MQSFIVAVDTSLCDPNGHIYSNHFLTNVVKNHVTRLHKWMKLLKSQKRCLLQMTSWHTAYPNHDLLFHIYTEAPYYKMEKYCHPTKMPFCALVSQIIKTQQDYHTMEKELFSIIMILKELCSLFPGAEWFNLTVSHSTATISSVGKKLWIPPSSITLERK